MVIYYAYNCTNTAPPIYKTLLSKLSFLFMVLPCVTLWCIWKSFKIFFTWTSSRLVFLSPCLVNIYVMWIIVGRKLLQDFVADIQKVSLASGLVKISAIYTFVPTYSSFLFFSVACSHRKWYLIRMCFILECITRFLDILMALVLSQSIETISSHFNCISCKVFFIQRTRVQQVVVAIYFSSVVDKDTNDFLFLNHDTKNSPK